MPSWRAACVASVFAYAGVANAATVELIAVAVNGSPITPTSTVAANPGDLIDVEILIDGWGDENANAVMRAYQVVIDADSYIGECKAVSVLPEGWEQEFPTRQCSTDEDCIDPNYPNCQSSVCRGDNHNPSGPGPLPLAFIDSSREDWTHAGVFNVTPATDISSLSYRFLIFTIQGGALDGANNTYAGQFKVRVLDNAQGSTTIAPLGGIGTVLTVDGASVFPDLTGLTINTPGTCGPPCQIVNSDPPPCAIDARFPHARNDPTIRLGWASVVVELNEECDPGTLTIEDFSTSLFGGAGFPPGIGEISQVGDNMIEVVFTARLRDRRWVCVNLEDGGMTTSTCIGQLPADANQDRTSAAPDITSLIDHLNNPVANPMELYQCNVDREGSVCGPADITALIDLLNGASTFQPYLQAQITDPCPAMLGGGGS